MVDDGLGGGVDPGNPPHTDDHVVDEIHGDNVCLPVLTAPYDPQHTLPTLWGEGDEWHPFLDSYTYTSQRGVDHV